MYCAWPTKGIKKVNMLCHPEDCQDLAGFNDVLHLRLRVRVHPRPRDDAGQRKGPDVGTY
jgi:hypothetical protein